MVYNVKGFDVYLEDAVEENNLIEYNLMDHIHPFSDQLAVMGVKERDQEIQRPDLLVPKDISASGYYITNANNDESSGWSVFALPNVFKPLGLHKHLNFGNN